jgi:hypothetical protein
MTDQDHDSDVEIMDERDTGKRHTQREPRHSGADFKLAGSLVWCVAGSSKGGRKADLARKYFEINGVKDAKQKRYPMKCTLCGDTLPPSKATAVSLRAHLLECKDATQAIRTKITQVAAEKINQQAAASASAAAARGVSRKRSSTGSSSQPSKQTRIDHFAEGSATNELLPAQRLAAHQHLLRALVCGGIPFKVGHCSLVVCSATSRESNTGSQGAVLCFCCGCSSWTTSTSTNSVRC